MPPCLEFRRQPVPLPRVAATARDQSKCRQRSPHYERSIAIIKRTPNLLTFGATHVRRAGPSRPVCDSGTTDPSRIASVILTRSLDRRHPFEPPSESPKS
jgi:hypothetical protein